MPSRRQLLFGAFRRTDSIASLSAAAEPSPVEASPQPKIVAFAEHCLAYQNVVCRSCGESCEHAAIRFSPRLGGAAEPLLNTDLCTGCGDCLVVCPTAALRLISPPESFNRSAEELAA
jgi:ferredoxin-type protein NapF